MPPALTLKMAIGTYDHTRPIKEGTVACGRLRLEQVECSPVNRAFRPMVNDLAFGVSEMAIVTYMLAKAFDRPLVALPLVLMRQPALATMVCLAGSDIDGPCALAGRTIGVRAYTQTTGVWARGILRETFGLDLRELNWITLEPAHVDGYEDPPNVRRAVPGKALPDMLRS
ncbi:MAG: ABC transporter substrate-binding protein, partial [Chloroflexota bacterium]|nr:ABC transporter substrate-binding protein [Chloroflexota bacterium]